MDRQKQDQDQSLLLAADAGNYEMVVALVESGCDINNKNPSRKRQGANTAFNKAGAPLHYAVRSGHIQIVAYLLSKGADINILDVEDWTPMHYACYNGHIEIVKLLLQSKPDLSIRDNYLHKTSLEFAKYRQFGDIIALLDPNCNDWKRPVSAIENSANSRGIAKKGLFLLRYKLAPKSEEIITKFRSSSKENDILIFAVDEALDNAKVVLKFSHDFASHEKETFDSLKQISMTQNSLFYRSSTISTNEHIIVYPFDANKHNVFAY